MLEINRIGYILVIDWAKDGSFDFNKSVIMQVLSKESKQT